MKEKEKLDAKISFRLPQSVNAEWRKKAEESGMNLGDWIRGQIKLDGVKPVLTKKKTPRRGAKIKPNFSPTDPALLGAIGRIGNNLNQIARRVNTSTLGSARFLRINTLLIHIRESVERLRC